MRTWRTGKGAGALWLGEKPVHRQKDKCTVREMARGGTRRQRWMKLKPSIGALEPSRGAWPFTVLSQALTVLSKA